MNPAIAAIGFSSFFFLTLLIVARFELSRQRPASAKRRTVELNRAEGVRPFHLPRW